MTKTVVQQGGPRVSRGFRVDIPRGQRVGRVSSEWFTRPVDEAIPELAGPL